MSAEIHSFIQAISIAPFQVHYYSEVLPTQHGYCVGVPRQAPHASEGLAQGLYVAARVGVIHMGAKIIMPSCVTQSTIFLLLFR